MYRMETGRGREEDLDLLLDVCDNIAPGAGLAAPADDHLRARALDPVVDRLGDLRCSGTSSRPRRRREAALW